MNSYARKSYIAVIFIVVLFIPSEINWHIGTVRLEPYRIVLIFAFLSLLPLIIRHKYSSHEMFLLFFCVWCFISYIKNHGGGGVQSGLINFLEVFISYFVGLTIAANIYSLRKRYTLLLIFFVILTPFALVEASNGYRVFHVIAGEIANTPYKDYIGDKYIRFGIHRSSTVFSHPILYSISALSLFPLIYILYSKKAATLYAIAIICTIFTSVTSAALLMLVMSIGMFVLYKVSRRYDSIFKVSLISLIALLLFLEFLSDRGAVRFIIDFTSFNSHTAYTRYLQWIYASSTIKSNIVYGIGFGDWVRLHWMPASVDSYWLVVALRHGLPGVILIAIFYILSLKRHWVEFRGGVGNNVIYYGFFVSICSIILAAFTVDFFDRAKPVIYLVLGFYNSFICKQYITNKEVKVG